MRRLLFTLALLAGCSQAPVAPPAAPAPAASPAQPAPERLWPAAARQAPRPGAEGRVAGAHDELLVMLPAPGDRFDAIAERFLGSASLAWHVAQPTRASQHRPPGCRCVCRCRRRRHWA
jgi:hypothetical protein